MYLLMTLAMAARSLRWRAVVLAGVTFAVCLLPMAVWYLTHPERNAQIVSAYQLEGGGSFLNAVGSGWVCIGASSIRRTSSYWRCQHDQLHPHGGSVFRWPSSSCCRWG